ncbi:MAG: glycosyltransferase [Gemmatimonadaceae bacterium]
MSDTDPRQALVSVVIVSHDNWPDLELAIESALNQSHPNVEVILVDNGSTDATRVEVPRLYASRIRFIKQENLQGSAGYNRGIRESRGEFIQLLDGDDFIAPNKIAKQLETFSDYPDTDIVYGDGRQIQAGTGRPWWRDWETTSHDDMLAALLDPPGGTVGLLPHSVLFRRSACERIGPWDEDILSADPDYWLRAAWVGCVFRYCPGSWCFHRRRDNSVSRNLRLMVNRMDQTYTKALGYIDREPYRSMVSARLAKLRFGRAVSDPDLTAAERKAMLASARELAPKDIPVVAYALARVSVIVPGARGALQSEPLKIVRRVVGRGFGILPRRGNGWYE